MSRLFHVLLILSIIIPNSQPFLEPQYGVILPKDPDMTVGSELTMFCHLKQEMIEQNYTSHDIGFRIGNDLMPSFEISIVNSSVAKLHHPNLEAKYNKKLIDCYVRKKDNFSQLEILDSTYMQVGYLPFKPFIVDVVVLNWEVLKFSWRVDRENLVYTTKYQAYWKKKQSIEWQKCPRQAQSTCIVPKGDGGFDDNEVDYVLKVVGSNYAGKTSSDTHAIHAGDIVKANPVEDFHVTNVLPRSIAVSFSSPKRTRALKYEISYTTPWQEQPKVSEDSLIKSPLIHTLRNLVPNTEHNISIRARYFSSEVWSDAVTVSATTLPHIPEVAPEVTDGGFRLEKGPKEGTVDIDVFWKEVPDMLMNGRFVEYEVSYSEPEEAIQKKHYTNQTWIRLVGLQQAHNYHVFVNVRNTEGYYKPKPGSHMKGIYIPGEKLALSEKTNFTAIASRGNRINLRWSAEQDTSYTVYWCRANHTFSQCQDKVSLRWFEAGENDSYTVDLLPSEDFTDFLFGVSQQSGSRSTGVKWTPCAYNEAADIGQPEIEIESLEDSSLIASIRPYPCPTILGRAYVYGYKIISCMQYDSLSEACIDEDPQTTFVPSLESDRFRIENLQASTEYDLIVTSLSAFKSSPRSVVVKANTIAPGMDSTKWLVLLSFIGLICLVLFAAGLFRLYKYGVICCKKATGRETIHFKVPNDNDYQNSELLSSPITVQDDEPHPQTAISTRQPNKNSSPLPLSIPLPSLPASPDLPWDRESPEDCATHVTVPLMYDTPQPSEVDFDSGSTYPPAHIPFNPPQSALLQQPPARPLASGESSDPSDEPLVVEEEGDEYAVTHYSTKDFEVEDISSPAKAIDHSCMQPSQEALQGASALTVALPDSAGSSSISSYAKMSLAKEDGKGETENAEASTTSTAPSDDAANSRPDLHLDSVHLPELEADDKDCDSCASSVDGYARAGLVNEDSLELHMSGEEEGEDDGYSTANFINV